MLFFYTPLSAKKKTSTEIVQNNLAVFTKSLSNYTKKQIRIFQCFCKKIIIPIYYKLTHKQDTFKIKQLLPPLRPSHNSYREKIFDDFRLVVKGFFKGIRKIWHRRDNNRIYIYVFLPLIILTIISVFFTSYLFMFLKIFNIIIIGLCLVAFLYSVSKKFKKKPSLNEIMSLMQNLIWTSNFNLFNLFYFFLLGSDQQNTRLLFFFLVLSNKIFTTINKVINYDQKDKLVFLNIFEVGLWDGQLQLKQFWNFFHIPDELIKQQYLFYLFSSLLIFHYPIYKFLKYNKNKKDMKDLKKIGFLLTYIGGLIFAQMYFLFSSADTKHSDFL